MNEHQNEYTTAGLKSLGAIDQKRSFGTENDLPVWKLGTTLLLFELIWSDKLAIHPAYASAFEEAKSKGIDKIPTGNLQWQKKEAIEPVVEGAVINT